MKELGLIGQDANEDEADILGAPMMIPFAGGQDQANKGQDLQFDDILKGMGLEDDVADILDGNSDEEEKKEKMIDTSNCGQKKGDGFYGGGPAKGVDIISSIMRENQAAAGKKGKAVSNPSKAYVED